MPKNEELLLISLAHTPKLALLARNIALTDAGPALKDEDAEGAVEALPLRRRCGEMNPRKGCGAVGAIGVGKIGLAHLAAPRET